MERRRKIQQYLDEEEEEKFRRPQRREEEKTHAPRQQKQSEGKYVCKRLRKKSTVNRPPFPPRRSPPRRNTPRRNTPRRYSPPRRYTPRRYSPSPPAEQMCTICFNTIAPQDHTRIKQCRHAFCYGCLVQWGHHQNTCPTCRIKFTYVTRANSQEIQFIFHDEHHACIICQRTHPQQNLTCCQLCSKIFVHHKCLDRPRRNVWVCYKCETGGGSSGKDDDEYDYEEDKKNHKSSKGGWKGNKKGGSGKDGFFTMY